MKYVAFLRGINIGKNRIKMTDLSQSFEKMGFENVKTYLNTGNVSFESTLEVDNIKLKIENELSLEFNYKAYALVYPISELENIVSNFPFNRDSKDEHSYVVFISDEDMLTKILNELDESNLVVDKISRGEGVIYWQVPKGMTLDSIVGRVSAQSAYKKYLTTRNIKTLEKAIG